ncbi:hypothetical protein GCM10009651_08050 [Microbacterium natoriense]
MGLGVLDDSGFELPEHPARSRVAAATVDRTMSGRLRTVKTSGSLVGHPILSYAAWSALGGAGAAHCIPVTAWDRE